MFLRPWLMVCAFGCACFLCAESAEEPHLLLGPVLERMTANLQRLPNYTCVQTIERYQRLPKRDKAELLDRLRLEVALVSGKELFSWPGASGFEDQDLSDLVGGGAIGNGVFALHARSIFELRTPTYSFAGTSQEAGRTILRWMYQVPRSRSGFTLRVGRIQGVTAYRGWFTVDANTLDVLQVFVEAVDIPPYLPLTAAADLIEYARMPIGAEPFLLPARAEMRLKDLNGRESINVSTFSSCRQYLGESRLLADDAALHGPVEARRQIDLPPGLELELTLTEPLDLPTRAVGDPVLARVARDVKAAGQVLVPKGAAARGRITFLRRQDRDGGYQVVGMDFEKLEWGNTEARAQMKLEEILSAGYLFTLSLDRSLRPAFGRTGRILLAPDIRSGSIFFVRGINTRLPKGFHTVWRTESRNKESNDSVRTGR